MVVMTTDLLRPKMVMDVFVETNSYAGSVEIAT